MAYFDDLPTELRLRIVEYLAMSSTTSESFSMSTEPFEDLRAVALLSREMAPIAQEVLFRAPIVHNYPLRDSNDITSPGANYEAITTLRQMQQLAQGLLAKSEVSDPQVVDIIKVLEQSARDYLSQSEVRWRDQVEQLDWILKARPQLAENIRSIGLQLVGCVDIDQLTCQSTPESPDVQIYPAWRVAALLSKVPRLESLSIVLEEPFRIELHDSWFEMKWQQLVGFSHLKSLSTNFLPPWRILILPTLRNLRLYTKESNYFTGAGDLSQPYPVNFHDFDADTRYNVQYLFNFSKFVECRKLVQTQSKITNLILNLDVDILRDEVTHPVNSWIWYAVKKALVNALEALESLQLRLHYVSGSRSRSAHECLRYPHLAPFLQPNIRSLVIDTCEVDWDAYSVNGGASSTPNPNLNAKAVEYFHGCVDRGHPFDPLLHLRRIVLPQEALIRHTERYNPVGPELATIPLSVESIEIIDSTRALNRWAKYVLDNPQKYPSLKQVVLWCDVHDAPLIADTRLRPARGPHSDRTPSIPATEVDHRGLRKLEDNIPETVWDELQKTGISLLVHTERERGWREIV